MRISLLTFVFILTLAPHVVSQESKGAPLLSAKAHVTIKTRDGSVLKGLFVKADSEVVLIELDNGGNLSTKHRDILSIEYTTKDSAPVASDEALSNEEAEKAIRTLNALCNAADTVSVSSFGDRLADAKTVIYGGLNKIKNSNIRSAISSALIALVIYHSAWEGSITTRMPETARILRDSMSKELNKAEENIKRAESILESLK